MGSSTGAPGSGPAPAPRCRTGAGGQGAEPPLHLRVALAVVAQGHPEIVAVAHQEERGHLAEGVGQGRHPVAPLLAAEGQGGHHLAGHGQPVGGGVHLVLGHLQVARAHVLVGVELDLLEAHHLGGDVHLAVVAPGARPRLLGEAVQDAHLRVGDGVGVVVHLGLADVDAALLVVVFLDEVGLALEDVDGLLVDHGRRAVEVHLGDDPGRRRT